MIGYPAMLIRLILLTRMCNSLYVGEIACLGICYVQKYYATIRGGIRLSGS
jgi:hypothetical protein